MSLALGISSVVLESASGVDASPAVVARHCRALGLRDVELRPDYLDGDRAPAAIAPLFAGQGIRVIYATTTVLADEPPAAAGGDSALGRDLAVAHALGARMLRVFPGDLARLGAAAAELAEGWARAASGVGVRLLVENVGVGPGADLRALAAFARRVGGLRLNVDVGNAAQAGFDAARIVAEVRDVAAMVHWKGLPPGAAPSFVAIDFAAVVQALSGWGGPACFEQDAGSTPWAMVAAWVDRLRSYDAAGLEA